MSRERGEVERIVVVGGGTAGWMAALYLRHLTRARNVSLTLVESPTISAIGVGEATVPSIVEFMRTLGIDEREFMRRCSATFKLAIRFADWRGGGAAYWHAFGLCGGQLNGLDLFHFWLKRRQQTGDDRAYADYSVQAGLCEAGKAAWPYGGASAISQAGAYAYHLDAQALADYLRELATASGVAHLHGHVRSAAFDESGLLTSLDIGGGRRIDGDLFVDATGFQGRLIEGELGDPWIDWSRRLLCDAAVAMPLPRDAAYPPYTLSSAARAGWIWRIPLQSRVGAGYVYSRAHISEDEATATLVTRSGLADKRAADPRSLKMRIGRRTRFWLGNCVAIGLASGFVEPLESTGIHMIFQGVKLLVDYWPTRGFAAAATAYNDEMGALYDEARDFIQLHYALAARDEPFWRDAAEAALTPSLMERIALYEETARVRLGARPLFAEPSYHFIFAGNERLPRRSLLHVDLARSSEAWQVLDRIRSQNQAFVHQAPSHAAYLAQLAGAKP